MARTVSYGAQRTERERHLTAVKALRIAVPGRRGRVARNLVRRQLRAGTLDPAALVAACGLSGPIVGTGPQAVLQVALRAALGAPEARPDAPVKRTAKRSAKRIGKPAPTWDEGALREAALRFNEQVTAVMGAPASARMLARELHLGHARAGELREWLEAHPDGALVTTANGTAQP